MTVERAALTDLAVRKMKPPATGQYELFDTRTRGLSVRVGKTGTKTFFVSFRVKGDRRKRRECLGRYEEITLAEARDRATKTLAQARDGISATKVAAHDPAKFAFDACVERFVQTYVSRRNKRPAATERMLQRHFVSRWRCRDVRTIEWSDVEVALADIGEHCGHVESNRSFGRLRKFYNWLITTADANDQIGRSPCDRQRPLFRETSRDRVLTDDELQRLWRASLQLDYPYRQIFQLWTVLGQRRSEVATMEWDHVDLSERKWRLPSRSTKNRQPHILPLPPLAVSILKECFQLVGCPFVFPGGRSSGKPVCGFTSIKRQLDRASNVKCWTPHDLRRTQATRMAEVLKVPQNTIDLIHNHKITTGSQVARIYNRYGYLDEQAEALNAWSDYLVRKVIPAEVDNTRRGRDT